MDDIKLDLIGAATLVLANIEDSEVQSVASAALFADGQIYTEVSKSVVQFKPLERCL